MKAIYNPIAIGTVLLLILASFLASITLIAYDNVYSSGWDQGLYLRLGLQIRNRLALANGYLHPLYSLLLAPIARPDIGYFTTAKLGSFLMGLLGLLAIYAVARRVTDQSGALAVTLMTAMNQHYRIAAGYVDVEVLLVPLVLISWYWAGKGVQSVAEGEEKAGRYAFAGGLLVGAAYLAKPTGMLLAVAFVIALLLVQGPTLVRRRAVWCFAAGFSVVALPLWIHNLIHYGNPLFNVNTAHLPWLDRWPDRYVYLPEEWPTLRTYLQTHTVGEAIARLLNGIIHAPRQWYEAGRPFWLPYRPSSWVVWACLGAGLFLVGKVTQRVIQRWRARRGWFWFSLTAMGLFYASFGWYSVVDDSPRFVLPLVPLIYIALFWLIREETAFSPRLQRWVSLSLVVICLVQAGAYLGVHFTDLGLLTQIRAHDRQKNEDSVRFMEALIRQTHSGESVILGPTHALAEWLAFDRELLPIPYVRQDWNSFSTWMVERGVRHIILDYESWDRRRPLLAQYWGFQDGLVATELPPGWTLVDPPSFPCNPCLFAFDGSSVITLEPEYPTAVRYEDSFALLGYDVEPPSPQADQPWRVILYWQVSASVEDDIHIFVHLLDDAGELVGQHDGVMAEGRMPAYHLTPNITVRDSHPLSPLPPGTYSLRIGMYRWETQERLPAAQRGQPVPEAYPQVGEVTVRSGDH